MTKIIAVLLIVAGIALWKFTRRAAFYRRNEYGVETFSSYGQMQGRRLFERSIRILAVLMVLAGIGHAIMPTPGHSAPDQQVHSRK